MSCNITLSVLPSLDYLALAVPHSLAGFFQSQMWHFPYWTVLFRCQCLLVYWLQVPCLVVRAWSITWFARLERNWRARIWYRRLSGEDISLWGKRTSQSNNVELLLWDVFMCSDKKSRRNLYGIFKITLYDIHEITRKDLITWIWFWKRLTSAKISKGRWR